MPRSTSPSSRRAWIEIVPQPRPKQDPHVALLAEGVDRNSSATVMSCNWLVALLAEGVDRNLVVRGIRTVCAESPSSRRAWIEIGQSPWSTQLREVALLAEGVDRNTKDELKVYKKKVALLAEGVDRNRVVSLKGYLSHRSPSSRRAWIEIRNGKTR